jgi:hypothetical protein
VAAVRHPAGALAGPQTFPNSAQSAFGHAESFLRCHCRFVPALHFLITGPCKKDVDASDNSWIKSGGGMAVRGRFHDIGTSLLFAASRSAGSREVTSLLTATNLPKG